MKTKIAEVKFMKNFCLIWQVHRMPCVISEIVKIKQIKSQPYQIIEISTCYVKQYNIG